MVKKRRKKKTERQTTFTVHDTSNSLSDCWSKANYLFSVAEVYGPWHQHIAHIEHVKTKWVDRAMIFLFPNVP